MNNFDYDYVVIGSGFGGSVSALRLTEKGYRVAVIEKGKRFKSEDFPKTNWNLRKYLWAPIIKCFGIQKLTLFKDVFILSGTGVGGGSLVYANTLLEPSENFYNSKNWSDLDNWKEKLAPHYQVAKHMLGATKNPRLTPADEVLKEVAQDFGQEHTFKSVDVAVYFSKVGDEGKKVSDPFFNGQGPDRAGCQFCGGCMVGCRFNAKNTLDKNYLYFAEKYGCKIIPEFEVRNVVPLNSDGSAGYQVHIQCSTSWFQKKAQTISTKGVVIAGGVLGTLPLLFRLRDVTRSMPKISKFLGCDVRTNSEALLGVTTMNKNTDWTGGVAIASGFYPDENTHVEIVRYSKGASLMRYLAGPMVDDGGFLLRPLKFFLKTLFHPLQSLFILTHRRWAESTVILLVMQNLDNKMKIIRKWGFLTTSRENEDKVPSYIPAGHKVARAFAKKTNGLPLSAINEVLFQIPSTAHILGGSGIGADSTKGVVDKNQKIFGYENIYVCDGSVIPANLGVNPSLTISAMSEFAMSKIPKKVEKA